MWGSCCWLWTRGAQLDFEDEPSSDDQGLSDESGEESESEEDEEGKHIEDALEKLTISDGPKTVSVVA